jgi:hypothetical protein
MVERILADAIVLAHFLFVLFAVAGGLLVLHRWAWAWVHVPAACWAALIEFGGWVCPLTPLENWFRARAGQGGYETGFVERYLIGLIYPAGLTRGMQILLGALVVAVNLAIYSWALASRRRREAESRGC